MNKFYVQYARISTNEEKQANGMEVQKNSMDKFVTENNGKTIAFFSEYESGGKNDRKEIQKAIECAKQNKAILLVSKLDRLGRNIRFIFKVKDEIGFVTVDHPEMNPMMLGMLAVFAEEEKRVIGERTKAGMKVAREKGSKIGRESWKGTPIPPKHLESLQERGKEKKEKLKKFIIENNDIIKGDPKILIRLLTMNGFTNHYKKPYKVENLKKLGLLEFIGN